MAILIDLDKCDDYVEKGQECDIKLNGRMVVKNSVLENIDTLSVEEFRLLLTRFKENIKPVITSLYFPSVELMEVMNELAPDYKVKFKTGKPGASEIMSITPAEFFEGERIFSEILSQIDSNWTDLEKAKYLFNRTGEMLSYNLSFAAAEKGNASLEKYARNIFTAVSLNLGMCSTFAWTYDFLCYRTGIESEVISEDDHDYLVITCDDEDYLVDPTFDSVKVKFGMKVRNFCVPREAFQKNRHNLDVTEAADYEISHLESREIEFLDRNIGYLEAFGGGYTDNIISNLGRNLEGEDNFSKMESFLTRLGTIKVVGRPLAYDYKTIIRYILSVSNDKSFVDGVNVQAFEEEDSKWRVLLEVRDKEILGVKTYVLDSLTDIKEVDSINADKRI